jgi:hypothetical protein
MRFKTLFSFFLTLAFISTIQSAHGLVKDEEIAQNPLPPKNTTIISEDEFLKLQRSVDPKKLSNPSEIQSLHNSSLSYYPVWYCVAQAYYSGAWYYWYSTNLDYARYRALNACTFYNGYTCYVNCQIRY